MTGGNRMRNLFVFAFTLCFSFSLSAQKNAAAILKNAAAQYEKSGGISVRFVSETEAPGNLPQETKGTIDMKDNRFVLITPDIRTFFDGTTQWVYMEGSEEVNVSNPAGEELELVNPILLLKSYAGNFTASYGKEYAEGGKSLDQIILTPRKKGNIVRIELDMDKRTGWPYRVVIQAKNNVKTVITVKELKSGINKPDSYFVFNASDYPDVEVIDLR